MRYLRQLIHRQYPETLKQMPSLEAVLDAIPGCHLILLPDAPRFTIVAATYAYLRATGCSREALIGRGLAEIKASPK